MLYPSGFNIVGVSIELQC